MRHIFQKQPVENLNTTCQPDTTHPSDITTSSSPIPTIPSDTYVGPMTRAQAKTIHDNLAIMANKCRRTLETGSTCKICGIYDEDSYHATVSCTKPRALRQAMRKFWNIPHEPEFAYIGTDWLPILAKCSKEQRSLVLMILWRSWHLRCNVIHDKGTESITNSRNFLLNYMNCLHGTTADDSQEKGKMPSMFMPPANYVSCE